MSLKRSSPLLNFIETHKIHRVLLIKLTSVGDVVHALPLAAALKKTYPFLELHWMVEDRCAPLLENNPLLDSVVIYPRRELQTLILKRRWGKVFKRLRALRRSLRTLNIDLSVDLQGLAKSGLMALMAWAPQRIGWSGLKELSYLVSRRIPAEKGLHVVENHLKVAEFLGAEASDPNFILTTTVEEKRWAKAFLKEAGALEGDSLIGLHLGTLPPPKCWPLEKYNSLVEKTAGFPYAQPILFGDKTDRERMPGHLFKDSPKVIDTVGTLSLRQLMALVEQCRVFIGGDSGPVHLAAGLGLPVIALFGGTDPGWSRPYGKSHTVIYKNLSCSPCLLTPSNKPVVCQGRCDCMEAIGVEEVLDSLRSVLGRFQDG
jgi:lipopolysaccharide heptosyltransferase I